MVKRRFMSLFAAVFFAVSAAIGTAWAAPLRQPAQAGDVVRIAVHLPLAHSAELDALIASQSTAGSPLYHHFLTPGQFRSRYAPDRAAMARAVMVLRANGFTIERTSSQLIYAHAPAPSVQRAFGVYLLRTQTRNGIRAAATAPLHLPAALSALHAAVAGLEPSSLRPQPGSRRAPANRYTDGGYYFADDLKQAYNFPAYGTANGRGVRVAIIGASDFSSSDLTAYLAHERVGSLAGDLAPAPTVEHLVLPGAQPFDPNSGDSFEADLDTQQIALTAPAATITNIATPNYDISSFLEGYEFVDETNAYDVVESSYGGCELFFTAPYENGIDLTSIQQAYHDLFRQGNAQGISFVEITQDEAGLICPQAAYFNAPPTTPQSVYKYIPSVAFWGDDSAVTAVGGGNLITTHRSKSLDSAYITENAYSDPLVTQDPYGTGNLLSNGRWGGGSGVSVLFSKPDYQHLVDTGAATRTVPDVSLHVGGCPYGELAGPCPPNRSADIEVFAGLVSGAIGTSASAPDFAGLLALKVQTQHSRLGNANYDLYELGKANTVFPYHFFRQGQPGDNGVVTYAPGWKGYNRIFGLGSPLGADFVFTPYAPLAGVPQTATNP